jgi:hypothetical protein
MVDDVLAGRTARWALAVRVLWVAVQLYLVFYLGQAGVKFFYQGF